MIDNLLYVSRATLPARTSCLEIDDILKAAHFRNRELDLTGALIFTQDHFAQLLEGPSDSISRIMSSIKNDTRHTEVRIVRQEHDATRRFQNWQMAYSGPSIFVARHVRVLAASFTTPTASHIDRLMALMVSLSRQQTN